LDSYAAIFVAQPGTVCVACKDSPLPLFFTSTGNEKVLVCHGREDGVWPLDSHAAIEKYKPDIIYCCFPAMMRRNTADNRIRGWHEKVVYYNLKPIGEMTQIIITFTEGIN